MCFEDFNNCSKTILINKFDKSIFFRNESSSQNFWGDDEDYEDCTSESGNIPCLESANLLVQSYLQDPLLPKSEDPLQFWKTNGHKWPILAKVVKPMFKLHNKYKQGFVVNSKTHKS